MANRNWLLGFASLASLSCAQAAIADDAAPAANKPATTTSANVEASDIVVTARRREERLQDVPISITALSGTAITQRGIRDVIDLQAAVPSLTVTGNGANTVSLSFDIRGQRAQEVQLLTDPPVGVYFDEVVEPRSFGVGNQFFDLQNVQVLKGVQGTLFGRNMTGGAVLIESAQPKFDQWEAEIRGQYGNYNLRDIFGMVNIPLGEHFALRLDGKYHDRDGYTTDIATGRKYDDKDYDAFRASLAFEDGPFKNNAVFDYTREHDNGSALKLNAYALGLDPQNGLPTTIAQQAGLSPYFPVAAGYPPQNLGAILAADVALPKYTVNYGTPNAGLAGTILGQNPFLHLRNYGITNKTTLMLGDITFKNIFGYRKIDFDRESDYDGSSANLIYSDQYTHSKNVSEEFQAQGRPLGDRLDLTIGAYYFSESGTDGSWQSQFPQLAAMGYAYNIPTLAAYFLPQPASFYINHQDAYALAVSYAFYGAGTYTISPELKLSAGVRYNNDLRKATITSTQPNFVFPTSPTTAQVGLCSYSDNGNPLEYTVNNCSQSRRVDFSAPTWDATLTYEPSHDLTAYVSTRHGYRAGGYNLRAENPVQFAAFLPETVQEFEAGLKTRSVLGEATLTTSSAVFFQLYSNVQKQNAVLVNGSVGTVVTNTAKEHLWGAEFEANLRLDNGIGLNAFMSYVNINVVGFNSSGVDPYEGTPKFQAGAALSYMRVMPKLGEVNFNLNAHYQSTTPLDDYDTSAIQPSYVLVNGRVELSKIAGTGFGAALFVNNLFNKYYMNGVLSLVSNGPTGLSGGVGYGAAIYAEPRMYGVELSYKF